MTGTKPVLEAWCLITFSLEFRSAWDTALSVSERYRTFLRNVVPWKHQEPLSKCHIILSQKTWIL